MQFNLPNRIRKFDKHNLAILQLILDYIEKRLQNEPRTVTFTVSMDNDVAGNTKDIVFCSTDSHFYGCTSGGVAGSATWKQLDN